MSEIKFSDTLAQIIERAKLVGNKKNAPLTAERFLVAAIDILKEFDSQNKLGEISEIVALGCVIKRSIPDLDAAKQEMMSYIDGDKSSSLFDDLYMKKRMQYAMSVADKAGLDFDSTLLMICLINDPSRAIKGVISQTYDYSKLKEPEIHIVKAFDLIIEKFATATKTEDDTQLKTTPSFTPEKKAEPAPERKAEPAPEQNKPPISPKAEMSKLVSDIKNIRTKLQESIFGQDNAINIFVTGYFQANLISMIDKSRKRPRATFLFAGPPGVGKTFLAEKAAEALGLPYMRFDMSEYCEKESAMEFCGSDGVYQNNKQGNFTAFIDKNPKCVVLLDEIEKAHISIIHLFLQVLDAGRLRDSNTDKEISLKDVILIFTTNAGRQLYQDSEDKDLSTISRKVIIDALEKDVNPTTNTPFFPAAICSRFASGNVVMFNHIGVHNLRHIAKKEIERHACNLKNETNISMEIDELVYTALLFSEGTRADARTTRSRAEAFFNDELYELLRLMSSEKAATSIDDIEKIDVCVDLDNLPKDIRELFTLEEKRNVIVLADEETVSLCASKNANCTIIGAQTGGEALEAIKTRDVDAVLIDVNFGVQANSTNLNIEDAKTPARELLQVLHRQKNGVPVYLLESEKSLVNQEEMVSFTRQGVRGVIKLSQDESDNFVQILNDILSVIHQQNSMAKLARENKLVSFETAQSVSKDGKTATIQLFDFKTTVAIDSEDSKNILSMVSRPNIRFDDVIGAGEAKKELTYFVEYLKNPKKYMGTGVKAPKGIILYGPPGTGKTMLAKAMASEAGVTYIAAEGNQFLKKYVGEGSEKIHELFRTARKYAPSILFVDEIDAIAKERRGGDDSGVEATLTAFLTEMDGFASDPSKPVFVLAATNFDVTPGGAKSLDPALMRRFDRRVYIDLPNREDRIRFLRKAIEKNKALEISEGEIDNIAMRSTGMSLAQLDSIIELSLRSAIREGSTKVTDAILEEAFETFNGGEIKRWDASQLERVARHEAGHALLCWLSGETPSYLTIEARGNHGGYMQHADKEGKAIYTKDELLSRIRTSLGGRAAEIAYYGECDGISTGASGDLASATNTAQHILCTYGMDDDFGLAVVSDAAANSNMSPEVRKFVNRILGEQMLQAVKLISENKDKIDALVEELMVKNHLNSAEIDQILSK